MARIDIAKVLLFNDAMDHLLLKKADALSAFNCDLKSQSLFQEVQRCMANQIGIAPSMQPFWWHIRTEAFPSEETYMHIFFGKVSMAELATIERTMKDTVMVGVAEMHRRIIAHRLKYLIPMAIVLSTIDSRHWPKP